MPIFNVDVTADPHRPRIVGPDHAPVSAINDFLSDLEQRARSPYTVRAYARGLAHFAGWLHEAGVDLDAVTRPVVGQYIGAFGRGSKRHASLVDRTSPNEGRQARTVNHRLSVLASYFAFQIRQDDDRGDGAWRQHSNPVSTPDDETVSHRLTGRDQPVRERRREFRRRVPRRLPARLDPLLIERLITTAVSSRDKAILTLLCRTGQRIGDWSDTNGRHGLLGMALSDVDEQHQTITVRLKGARQDHRVPVTDDFWPLFRQYLQAERPTPARTAAAWVAQRRGHGVPLSYAAFESALRLLGRKVGATVRAHQFRHTVAQGVLETSGNLKVTQALLGHAHLSTTADLYLTVEPRALVDAVAAVKARSDAAQAQPYRPAETGRERYAFAYDAVTIEELERAVAAIAHWGNIMKGQVEPLDVGSEPDDSGSALGEELHALIDRFTSSKDERRHTHHGCAPFLRALASCPGRTWQVRWDYFEHTMWPRWIADEGRPLLAHWMAGPRAIVLARRVIPTWAWLAGVPFQRWIARLPIDHEWRQAHDRLRREVASIPWSSRCSQDKAVSVGLRVLIARGYSALDEITDDNMAQIPSGARGQDVLDVALCRLGILDRTPQRGTSRRSRRPRHSIAELVAMSDVPAPFRAITSLYLETYATRISHVYVTLRHKLIAMGHFWRFLAEQHPHITKSADVLPAHGRAYIPYAIALARERQRGDDIGPELRNTAHVWLLEVRTFFTDLCTWATETDSPFGPHAPRVVPLMRRDLVGIGFEKARARTQARITATILDLEREMPTIRACALQHWKAATAALSLTLGDRRAVAAEAATFWDWALVELLVQSGLRIEEVSELTTLDILKRQLPDGRVYYLLHIKPSKFDRARVIPIGDGLGRVIAEIIRHVKRFYGAEAVPSCDHWDHHERQPRPRAPYLLQGDKHPSPLGIQTIRARLRAVSIAAGARRADNRPLVLLPHDCRGVFASEHLNNNVPVHVIQALLGHATLDTIMVYAKLYPTTLIAEYRKAVRGLYNAFHGDDSLRNPTAEEWAAFTVSCNLRDMGTHLCALPTGEYCPKGLVCLGCTHAQPKQSAAPIFRRMLASHERALGTASQRGEPAGQIAARQLEVSRIGHALRRAEDLPSDVAAAIEGEAGGC